MTGAVACKRSDKLTPCQDHKAVTLPPIFSTRVDHKVNEEIIDLLPLHTHSSQFTMLPTPDLSHLKRKDYEFVYEPAGNQNFCIPAL